MDIFDRYKEKRCSGEDYVEPGSKNTSDTEVQLVISLSLGLFAFISFCVRLLDPEPFRQLVFTSSRSVHSCLSCHNYCIR
jgi:hypothetical protein